MHLAREAPWFIMRLAGQAQHRRSRLTSNVRHRWNRWCPASTRLGQVASPRWILVRSGQAAQRRAFQRSAVSQCRHSTLSSRAQERVALVARGQEYPPLVRPRVFVCRRCLTLRSSRRPTALRLAREASRYMMRLAGQAQYRRSRLTSNVRPRKTHPCSLQSRGRHRSVVRPPFRLRNEDQDPFRNSAMP